MRSTIRPTAASSSSGQIIKSIPSDAVLSLGKKIVDEFSDEQHPNTLTRWMAHALAEKIKAAESAPAKDRTKAVNDCAALILQLWAHRHQLPNGKRPFEAFEPIFRALESLDDRSPRFRYFELPFHRNTAHKDESALEQWLQRAKDADEAARAVVKYCLTNAADVARVNKEEWAALASKVATVDDLDVKVVVHLVSAAQQLEGDEFDATARQIIREQVEGLEKLIAVSQEIIANLKVSLEKAPKRRTSRKAGTRRSSSQNKPPK